MSIRWIHEILTRRILGQKNREPYRPPATALDVLRVLGIEKPAEEGGVQWTLRIFPHQLSVPGYAVLGLALQNAYDRPRRVGIRITESPTAPREDLPASVGLRPAESGVFRIPLFLSGLMEPGEYRCSVKLTVTAPEGAGERRVTRRYGPAQSCLLRVAGRHNDRPLNIWAYEWSGFQSMYAAGQSHPDLQPFQVLTELAGTPIA